MPSHLHRTVFASRATSNHHRLALDALRLMNGPQAAAWRDVFLHHHHWYLAGAKAPDAQFKDFKNHVLHVDDGGWGGALAAARDWRGRFLGFLQQRNWKDAVTCAGVMSHYLVDPFQPLHTGQTEEENIVHAALERSLSKAYPALIATLDDEGWPEATIPPREDWLEALILDGARAARASYDLCIDHFDLERAQTAPAEALDGALLKAAARQYGRAAATLARTIERTIADAGVDAPRIDTRLDVVAAWAEQPLHALKSHFEDLREKRLVRAQFAEFRKTGKVIRTLSEDDKTIRALHAAEVLKTPIAELDARPARAPGAAFGRAVVETAAPDGRRLSREAPVVDAPAIGPKAAARLEALGVFTVGDLLDAKPGDLAARLMDRRMREADVARWQAMTALCVALPDVRAIDARLLSELGIGSPQDLAGWSSASLAQRLEAAFERLPKDAARGQKPPSAARAAKWVAAAQGANAQAAPVRALAA